MIVVVGNPDPGIGSTGQRGGLAASIARSTAEAGGTVQLVARVADDPAGDRLILELATAGVGHVATLRQPPGATAPILEAPDLDLALRYLADVSLVVLTEVEDAAVIGVAAGAAAWSRGHLIVLIRDGSPVPADLPAEAMVLEAPATDPEGAFAALVGTLAAALDRGVDPSVAFREAMERQPGWTPIAE